MHDVKRLDVETKQDVQYCIPLFLRDEQIKQAITRVKGRIQPGERREDPVAVVCFGPSLQDTWEQVRDFKTIITCSGSHKFLVERSVIPTFHVEVDPRPHKVALIGPPSAETTYLIASTCNPKVFDHLEGMHVLLWHVFDSKEESVRVLPRGEWALTGGCDVGSRALTIAGFLGFRDVHVFGMDGCAKSGAEGHAGAHAAAHPNDPRKYAVTTYDGIDYQTTPALLEAARQVWHELDQMPAVRATFHGQGLVQAMAKRYKRKSSSEEKAFENVVGFVKPALISEEMRELNRRLHADNLAFGVGGGKHAKIIINLVETLSKNSNGVQISVLDYGCGKSYLQKDLPFPIFEYDPAIPEKSGSPRPADVVACTDVLEHVEPEYLGAVLADLRKCVKQIGFFVIHTGPSGKTLADGRNTHLIQKDRSWWKQKLKKHFTIGEIMERGPLLYIIVAPKAKKQEVA